MGMERIQENDWRLAAGRYMPVTTESVKSTQAASHRLVEDLFQSLLHLVFNGEL